MEIKLIKYLNKELKRKYENQPAANYRPYENNNNLDDTQAIFFDMNYRASVTHKKKQNIQPQPRILESMNLSAIDFDNTVPMMETDNTQLQELHNLQSKKGKSPMLSNRPQFGQSPQTQLMKQQSRGAGIIEKYRHK